MSRLTDAQTAGIATDIYDRRQQHLREIYTDMCGVKESEPALVKRIARNLDSNAGVSEEQ